MVVIRKPKMFSSNFDFPKDDKNSKHKTELIMFSWKYNQKKDWLIIVQYNHGNGTVFMNTENSKKMNLINSFLTWHKD